MKLTSILLLAAVIQVSAKGTAQTVTYSAKEQPLQKVFAEIEKQTGFVFFFVDANFKSTKPVTVNLQSTDLTTSLETVLQDQPLKFRIEGNTILISKKSENTTPSVTDILTNKPPITGVVRGPDGQALAGVNIVVKGTKRGTTTKGDGTFIIVANEGEILIISSIGYTEQQIPIKSNTVLESITLRTSNSKLDEVQIVAYGSTTRRLNTGNVGTLKSEEIQRQPVNNPLYALQGRIPGLQVTPTNGFAGGGVNIQIRGINTIRNIQDASQSNSANPLIVVDGLPIINNFLANGNVQIISALNFINPNDIASIDVLKDADATSVYGSRGANGVILITTKKGKIGQTRIELNVQSGWSEVPNKMRLLSTHEYIKLRKEAFLNSGVNIETAALTLANSDLKLWDTTRFTDWQDIMIGNTARYNDFQGSISGGTATVQYILGANFHKETTVFPGSNSDQKGSAHFSLTGISPNQKFKSIFSASYMTDKNTLPGIDFTSTAIRLSPNAPAIYKSDGSLNWEVRPNGLRSWTNPFAELLNIFEAKTSNLIVSEDISYRLLPSLTFKMQASYNELRGNTFKATTIASHGPGDEPFASADFGSHEVKNLSIEPQLNYGVKISSGYLEALVGASYQSTTSERQLVGVRGYTDDALLRNIAAGNAEYRQFTLFDNSYSQYKYAAVFSRVNYNWKNKYLINLTARRDGSSRFGPGRRFGNFGSIGTAWIFSEENFIRSVLPVLSFGKVRFSYGSTGNDGIGDYQYLERYQLINDLSAYQGITGYRTRGFTNAYYQWETTRKVEFSLETGFFKDRILLTATYFRNRSDDQLQYPPYPSIVGQGEALFNVPALIQNMGVELTLMTENIKTKNFTWSTNIFFTRNRNKLIDYPGLDESPYVGTYEIGQPFYGTERLYKYAGVDPETGKYQFQDVTGKLVSDPTDPSRIDAGRYTKVMTMPRFYGGLSNTFSYKGFAMDIFFQFTKQLGNNPLSTYTTGPVAPGSKVNLPIEFLSRWRTPGDIGDIQKLFATTTPAEFSQAIQYKSGSNAHYVDASFIRLKNFSLSYRVPKLWIDKMKFHDVRLYVQGQNLLTITNYTGLDPETQSFSLPPLRTITAGLQIGL